LNTTSALNKPSSKKLNALILSGGGARAAYQVGVLSHIAQRNAGVAFPILSGVSAGAINAAFIAGHRGSFLEAVAELKRNWCSLTTNRVFRSSPSALGWMALRWAVRLFSGGTHLAPRVRGLVDTSPLRRFIMEHFDPEAVDENVRAQRLHALGVVTTCYRTGQTVTYVQGEPTIEMWQRVRRHAKQDSITVDHIMASAAIPLMFPAIRIQNEGYFGDGSLRQAAPLAPAVHLGADRVLAIANRIEIEESYGQEQFDYPPPAHIIGLLFHSIFLDNLDADAALLERINTILRQIPPEHRTHGSLRPIDLLIVRPSQDLGALAGEYEQFLPGAVRFLLRGLGAKQRGASDFLSYILFEPEYVMRLIQIGEQDAEKQWDRIRDFFLA